MGAETIAVAETDIASLANAPDVLDLAPAAGPDGGPALLARLRFANDCLAGAGMVALAGTPPGGLSHLAILQRVAPDGCPDIFQPTERQALIQPHAETAEIRVIAKPSAADGPRQIDLDRTSAAPPGGTPAAPTAAFGADAALPAFTVQAVVAAAGGYRLSGVASVGPGCDPAAIGALVYEVPDAEGAPSYDAILLTAPRSCAGGGQRVELDIRVSRPVAGGWRVYVANEASPALRPLG